MKKYTLKELRARKGWTQAETALKLGVSNQTYNAWEKDISNVGIGKVNKLANLFDVTLDEIFFTSLLKNNSSNKTVG